MTVSFDQLSDPNLRSIISERVSGGQRIVCKLSPEEYEDTRTKVRARNLARQCGALITCSSKQPDPVDTTTLVDPPQQSQT